MILKNVIPLVTRVFSHKVTLNNRPHAACLLLDDSTVHVLSCILSLWQFVLKRGVLLTTHARVKESRASITSCKLLSLHHGCFVGIFLQREYTVSTAIWRCWCFEANQNDRKARQKCLKITRMQQIFTGIAATFYFLFVLFEQQRSR